MKLITKYLTGLHNVRPGTVAHKCTLNSKWHSKFQKSTPILKTSLRIWKLHSEFEKHQSAFKNFTPNNIRKHHSEFENITSNSKTSSSEFENATPNTRTPLRIRKYDSKFENATPNSKTLFQFRKLHSQFENFTPNSKASLPELLNIHSHFNVGYTWVNRIIQCTRLYRVLL